MTTFTTGDLVVATSEQRSTYTDNATGQEVCYWRLPAGVVGTVVDPSNAFCAPIPGIVLVDFGQLPERASFLPKGGPFYLPADCLAIATLETLL
jgi:hypothetical protein